MRQPQRSQPSRSARLAAGALSSTTLPEVLEHSTLRLSDIMRSSECIAGEGILVKLFPVSPKYIQSVGDSKRTLWIVSSRDASNEFPSKWEDTQKSKAKTSQLTKAGSLDERTAKAKVTNGRAESRRPLVRGKRKPLMSDEREKGDGTETDDPSDEEEEDAESDNDEEVGEDGDGEQEVEEEEEEEEEEEGDAEDEEAEDEEGGDEEAGEEEVEEEEGAEEDGTENHNAAKDVTTVREAAEDVENEHDAEERDDDRNDGEHNEAQTKEADKRKDKDDSGEEDKEKDAQGEKEREKEAEREHAAEEAGDNIEKPGGTKEKDSVDEDEQAEENEDEDDEMPGEESGNRDEVREDKETMEQRVAANNRDGAWRGCRLGNMTDKEGEGRDIGSDGEERMAGENDGDSEERRKRPLETCEAFDCPTPGDRPNKRSKGDDSESEDTSATDHLTRRPFSSETTPRPRTPSPTFITASPSSAITIVRQTSAVPGLEDTEKAVWDAAHRDSVICLLPLKQQTKMVRTALSLGSEGGIKALQHFVYNARRNGWRKVKPLESNFDLSAPHSGVDVWHTTGALVPRDSGLAHFSALYQQIDFIDNKATLFSITKRVKLAAMAQYRKGLLQEDAGKNQARDVNLYLFRAIYPDHATIERPDDKATKSRARDDWNRLRDRLREGRLWLEVRDLFGGVGAFLALPPQCVPDRHVVKMPAKTFESWLRLLDVAWRALDAHARLTLNNLVRMSLAGQSLPEGSLMLEMLEDGTDTAPISLSGMLTGWPAFDRNSAEDEGGLTATLTQHEEDGDTAIPGTPLITASTTSKAEEARDGRLISQEGMMGDLEDGLFNGLDDRDLDECLN